MLSLLHTAALLLPAYLCNNDRDRKIPLENTEDDDMIAALIDGLIIVKRSPVCSPETLNLVQPRFRLFEKRLGYGVAVECCVSRLDH